jgi:hypothetical protein
VGCPEGAVDSIEQKSRESKLVAVDCFLIFFFTKNNGYHPYLVLDAQKIKLTNLASESSKSVFTDESVQY